MVDHKKLIEFINSTGVTKVFTSATSRIKWEGIIPAGIRLVAHDLNVFGSEKNTKAFIAMVNGVEPVIALTAPVQVEAPTLQQVVEKYDIVTDEIAKIKSKGPRSKKEDK
jgi:hypothetical protein